MTASGYSRRRAAAKAKANKSEHYIERRRELVDAAAAVFQEKGFSGTSIDDIAQAAGIDRASVYYYAGGKQELFDEVVLGAFGANIEMAEAIRDSDSPAAEKLSKLIESLLVSYARHYPYLFVFLQENVGRLQPGKRRQGVDHVDMYRRFERALEDIVQEGIDGGVFRADISARLATYAILGMINWSHRWFDPNGPIDAIAVGRAFARVACEGLVVR
jgi:AcrR family transcriptional regulator